LKVNHRNADVREKAEGLVRRIKGYRDRGSLRDGVPLKQGVSRVRSVAVEPDFDASLPWLDPSHADDRLVATFIEVMRRNPRSPVVLVTRDLNLQNKMEFARLPFMEPPSPE
jgi:predicted ribonuclease YlaK